MYEYITLYKRVRRYRSKLLLGQFIEVPDGWEDYAGAPVTIRVDTIVSFTDHKVYLTEDREINVFETHDEILEIIKECKR